MTGSFSVLELGAQGWSELVNELVALAAQEGLGLRFARLEDDDRLAGLAVIGDVEVVERDIGSSRLLRIASRLPGVSPISRR